MDNLLSWLAAKPYRTFAMGLATLAAILVVALVGTNALGGGAGASPSPGVQTTIAPATASPTLPPTTPPAPSPTASPTPSPTPAPALPALLGAIGDSYSQAWSVSPTYPHDHTQFSWVIGTDPNDGVLSLLERFKALGASPTVVDAATSGKKMADAPRQAALVAAAAAKLAPGQIAYVTFELGTNDLCDDPKTEPNAFESDLRSAVSTLQSSLPSGSRILMLAVPDFSHLRDVTQADAAARANLALTENSTRCPPFLGDASSATIGQAKNYLKLYDASLAKVCAEVNAATGGTGLHCTWDQTRLSLDDFTVADLSTADYFHPSLTGQAKLAEAAWKADVWAGVPLP